MMTLQELLDLLPDNTTGAIDAADLRTIVTELYTPLAEAVADNATQAADLLSQSARILAVEEQMPSVQATLTDHEGRIVTLETA